MIFTSNIFLFLFLPAFLLIYYSVGSAWRSSVIVAGSYIFYAWWRPDFLFLFLGITLWNYYFGALIKRTLAHSERNAFRWLCLGVAGNLMALGYFKYTNFGVEVIAAALQPLGIETFTLEYIILPLGISFYVFQALSYIVDIYRKEAEPAKNFIDFAAFIALFPQLIAGPILRYKLIDQQLKQRDHSWELFSLGASRFMLGFVKKVLIADSLAPLSAEYMSNSSLQFADAWFGSLVTLIQLYFDFSGYSDMAIGLGLMMGFRFAENFNQPFLCMSLTEFWRRWHLTLADFLKDYVYKPLLRTGKFNGDSALFTTMLLSGVWHGASFAFILFGLSFAVFMVLERRLGLTTDVNSEYRFIKNIVAVTIVVAIMPLFSTGDTRHAIDIYQGMLGVNGLGSLDRYVFATSHLTMAFVGVAIAWLVYAGIINRRFYRDTGQIYAMQSIAGANALLLWVAFGLSLTRLAANSFSPFLYFQF
jgi:alginate O-acetyltransferase complex protein AlgI